MNQLSLSLNNHNSVKTFLIFLQVILNIIQHIDNKSKKHQSHIRHTQRRILTRKPIKGENLFFFKMIGSLLSFVHHLCLSTNSKWGYYLYFTSSNLFESTNSLVSLEPTRRKHQLPISSSTNWMEPPTSNYTGSNLYNREHLFSLPPPCHPVFLATTRCKLQLLIFKHQLEYQRTTVLPRTTLPP